MYRLYINGVLYEDFKTLKFLEKYLFNLGINIPYDDRYYVEVKKSFKKMKLFFFLRRLFKKTHDTMQSR